MKRFIVILTFISPFLLEAQVKPKLVVGIVVDQMRQEYLYRFEDKFGAGGFKRLMSDGFMLKNANFNYVPTETGPGHASVYTGTTPAVHGIIGNDWYDRGSRRGVNCVEDPAQKPVGNDKGNGDVSPWRMLSTTITDELELATQKNARVIGLSMKDRGAVLPAGHLADGAYWYDGMTGKFISSTFYKPGLPQWLEKFNSQNLAEIYANKEWNTLLPVATYTESGPDDSPYETRWKGSAQRPVFPYKLKEIRGNTGNFELIISSPFGNDLLTDAAKASIEGEEMGKDEVTDFLAISYSSTDYVGHAMGPNAVEVEDMYLRLDKNIEDLLATLDKKVGVGQYTVFLTADHGMSDVPQYFKDNKIPAGILLTPVIENGLKDFMRKNMPDADSVIENIYGNQIYLNHGAFKGSLRSSGVDLLVATELISQYLMQQEGIADVFPSAMLRAADFGEKGIKGSYVRGYNHKRSGDISFVMEPHWTNWRSKVGSTHGSAYSYDNHVPVLFFGAGVKKGSSSKYHTITDIAPTLSVLLRIKFPSGCTGQPVSEMLD